MNDELRGLLQEVADICDSGVCYQMNTGADSRYDHQSYGEGLQEAYLKFLKTESGKTWYDGEVEQHNSLLT